MDNGTEMLDRRAKTLLKSLVERYIADGQPVGSRTLARHSGLDLSPATIRNVMADLEELGLIASPHTSSGRVPTPAGYRFFVDTLLKVEPLDPEKASAYSSKLRIDDPARLMTSAAALLSSLSRFAGVVRTPRRSSVFRQIEFMRLSDYRYLLIIVTPEGDVQNRIIQADRTFTQDELVEAANYLNRNYAGLHFDEIRGRLKSELIALRSEIAGLMRDAVEASDAALSEESEPVVISGERNLLDISDLAQDMSRLRGLFDLFEQKTRLARLLEASGRADGVQIFIGGESELVPMEELSIVVAPYEADGRVVGTLGVVGPTRMAYDRVIPIVDITARLMSSALSSAHGGALGTSHGSSGS